MTIIEKIKDLIAKDKTDYVFRELLNIQLDQDTVNTILLLSSQWNAAKKDYNLGLTTSNDWFRIKNKINFSLMLLLSDISQDIKNIENIENSIENISKKNTITASGNDNFIIKDANNSRIFIGNKTKNETEKMRLLIINSLPKDKQAISVNEEIRVIEQALFTSTDKDKIEIITKNAVKFDELVKIIHLTKPTYIHFSLHSSKVKGLIFEDNSGASQFIDKTTFSDIFSLTTKNNKTKFVLLNACNSYEYAKEITKYVDYSIGMNDFIPDVATLAFSKGFYEMLFEGEEIEYAFNAGIIALKLSKIEFNSSIPIAQIPVLTKR